MLIYSFKEYWQQYLQFDEAPMPLIAPRKSIAVRISYSYKALIYDNK